MSSVGNSQLNTSGALILGIGDSVLFRTSSTDSPCRCVYCQDCGCASCSSKNSFCCYGCDTVADLTMGTIVVDPSASGLPYYALAVDAATVLSGATIQLTYCAGFFYYYSTAVYSDSDYVYFWYVQINLNGSSPGTISLQPSVTLVFSRIYKLCIEDGDQIDPSVVPCGEDSGLLNPPELNSVSWYPSGTTSSCCEYTAGFSTPTSAYFTTLSPPTSLTLESCSLCEQADYPTTLSFDPSQCVTTCFKSYGAVTLTGPFSYTGSAVSGSNTVQVQLNPQLNSLCCFELTVSFLLPLSTCEIKTYKKCGTPDDPTGTYTLVGGSETVDVV